MGDKTGIAWTDATWNPVTGCSKVSAGCKHCYAERVFPRAYHGQTVPDTEHRVWDAEHGRYEVWQRPRRFTDVKCHPERLDQPLRWRRPRRVFVNSMSDLFHPDVPDSFIAQVFGVMALAPQHTFQVLTKRPERMRDWIGQQNAHGMTSWACAAAGVKHGNAFTAARDNPAGMVPWPLPNVWLGVSVEDQATADERIPVLLDTPAAVRFTSAEPLLGPVDLFSVCAYNAPGDGELVWKGPDWVIVGGESGPRARPFDLDWGRSIVAQCRDAGVPVFVKQLGAHAYDETPVFGITARWHTAHRSGAVMDEWPVDLQVQEWPE